MPVSPPLPLPGTPPFPGLRLPLSRRRLGPGAALSFLIHTGVIALLVIRGRDLLDRTAGTGPHERGGGTGGRPVVNFFALPVAAPEQIAIPAAPRADLAVIGRIPLDLPRIDLPHETLPLVAVGIAGAARAGGGAAGGAPGGAGAGGADVGPGTGGEGGYIFPASPRTTILPPLARVPGSVAGRTYRVRFWVSAAGRVTRLEVEPPIADADYSREFQQRMMAYQFYPAHTRDGRNVTSVVTVPLRIGN